MEQIISRRALLATGLTVVGTTALAHGVAAADDKPEATEKTARKAPGALTLESLGTMLQALGLKPAKVDTKYDFTFTAKHDEEWNHTMSAVLSTDEKTVWIMAWLDDLPKSASDVPRTALLRLLADNDKMGNGIFFAYVSTVRKFILQRVIDNDHITSVSFKADLIELGQKVVDMYAHWNVENWKQLGVPANSTEKEAADDAKSNAGRPPNPLPASKPAASKTAAKEATVNEPTKKK